MLDILRQRFPDSEIPATPGGRKFALIAGMMEFALGDHMGAHEGMLEELKARAQALGLEEVSGVPEEYQNMRFLYERRLTLQTQMLAGLEVEAADAQLLFTRGFDPAEGQIHTLLAATLVGREKKEGKYTFTTAFIPHSQGVQDPFAAVENSVDDGHRPYVSGTMTAQGRGTDFDVQIDKQHTSRTAIDGLRNQMRLVNLARRTALNIDALSQEAVMKTWLEHFAINAKHQDPGSMFYQHFPRPSDGFLLVLR